MRMSQFCDEFVYTLAGLGATQDQRRPGARARGISRRRPFSGLEPAQDLALVEALGLSVYAVGAGSVAGKIAGVRADYCVTGPSTPLTSS